MASDDGGERPGSQQDAAARPEQVSRKWRRGSDSHVAATPADGLSREAETPASGESSRLAQIQRPSSTSTSPGRRQLGFKKFLGTPLSTAALLAVAAAAVLLMLLVSLAATDTSTISYEQETRRMFVEWKAKYGQTYKDVGEEECRYAVFNDSRRRVDWANARDAGVTSYGLNHLSCLTKEEIFRGHGVRMGEKLYEEETRRMFVGWKAKYGKTYKDAGEEECRYKLLKGNRRIVVKLNTATGEIAYGLNQFGDLTNEEVREFCYERGGVQNNPEMERKLSARCQAAAADMSDTVEGSLRLIRSQVCQCIATELKQSTEPGGSGIPGDEAHMWI